MGVYTYLCVSTETNTYVAEIPERDKLHNIPNSLLSCAGPQNAGVPIQELHGGKIGIAHANDDDGHG